VKIRVAVPDQIGVLLALQRDEFGSHPSNQYVIKHAIGVTGQLCNNLNAARAFAKQFWPFGEFTSL
jgi:hypothetical protein